MKYQKHNMMIRTYKGEFKGKDEMTQNLVQTLE